MINSVVLVGRLTKDPELKYSQSGLPVTSFTLAVNRKFSNNNNERNNADFIRCVTFRKTAENVSRFVGKGSLVGVEGRIQTGSYDAQDGSRRYTTDIVCETVQFLETRNAQQNTMNVPNQNQQSNNQGYQSGYGGGQSQPPNYGGQNQGNSYNQNQPTYNKNQNQNNNNNDINNDLDFGSNSNIDISDDDLPF